MFKNVVTGSVVICAVYRKWLTRVGFQLCEAANRNQPTVTNTCLTCEHSLHQVAGTDEPRQ